MIVPLHDGDPGDSYKPLLTAVLQLTEGPVLELGSGIWSTPLLAELCGEGRHFLSLETDAGWAFEAAKKAPTATIVRVPSWEQALTLLSYIEIKWSVAFIDLAPGHERRPVVEALRNRAHVLVVHDTEPDKSYAYKFEPEFWGDHFTHIVHDDRSTAWTTAVSNSMSLSALELSR